MKTTFGATNQILAFVQPTVSISVQVDATGITADENGKKIIPAGSPLGGATSALEDDTAVLSVTADATTQGIALHDIDVTAGNSNAAMLIFGFVNLNRIPNVTIADDVKTALNGKVTFLKRN